MIGCKNSIEPEKPPAINEAIVQIGEEHYQMGVWTQPTEIYATEPLDRLRLDNNLTAKKDTTLIPSGTPAPIFIEKSEDGKKLLFIETPLESRPGFWGPLYEIDTQTGEKRRLRDSNHVVSSAVYLPGSSGKKVVYYSYGSIPEGIEDGPIPGYYLLDTETGTDSLLVEHASPAGLEEIFNGFDVSPDGRTLLYPINYDNIGGARSPKVATYDLPTGIRDTLSWSFRPQLLWMRYGPSGDQLLYNIYQEDALSISSGRVDSIGVIDLDTEARRTLRTTTNPEGESIDLFPRWSPDGQHIVYGSGPVAGASGAVGNFSLHVLKNVN
ncbi:hypothetical protein CRI93_09175 [Longimonas halophila]|uniref:Uncharacterized protein n=2 Tax=Longimonas halophila TaxID=1469170 RepID=A0A2H3NLR4_9BACT|nr:hypothetical protein CRI93_09175 [Longimonas halophila]